MLYPFRSPPLCTLSPAFDAQWHIHSWPLLARVHLLSSYYCERPRPGPHPISSSALSSLVCSWHSVSGGAGAGVLAHTLESILIDVTNAGHGEPKGGATGAMKKEGGVCREGGACLVHEHIDGTPYLLLPLKVVGGTYQEVLPPAQEGRRGLMGV